MLLIERRWPLVLCGGLLCSAMLAAAIQAAIVTPSPTTQTVPGSSAADLERRLNETGLTAGSPVMIRIFKKESVLQLWMQKEGRFELFRSYRICSWSGKLGPKQREGDRQAPEGFYSVDVHQLRLTGRNAHSFYIDFPNAHDRSLGRTGSAIMVHGRCQSIGCFAMTTPAMEEIYALVERALHEGQERIEVHAFPFRVTNSNLAAHAKSEWHDFWLDLKQGYDLFEQMRIPPKISVCGRKYVVDAGDLPNNTATAPPDIAPAIPRSCETEEPDVASALTSQAAQAPIRVKPPGVIHAKHAQRFAGRNVRKAYANARRARMLAHARRTRTSEAAGKTRRQ